MAHPDNPRNPTWWHARDYGLVSANPFGPKKNGGDGEMVVMDGDSLTLRYRFIFHNKSDAEAAIKDQFKIYSESALTPRTDVAPIPTKKQQQSKK